MTTHVKHAVLIARQPIFDNNADVYAYELLFRQNHENQSGVTALNGDMATTVVINNAFMEFGLEQIVGQKLAFINLTRNFLTGSIPLPFTQKGVVIEVLEDIEVDNEIIQAVTQLSQKGFTIALDDFIFSEEWRPLVKLAAIIKIDLMAYKRQELIDCVAFLKTTHVKLLAEKIETLEEYELCKSLGFDFYQGYFFCKPTILDNQPIPSNNVTLLRILSGLQKTDIEFEELEALVSQDASLSFKLLRFLNSAALALPRKIESIGEGLVILGLKMIKKWATLIALSGIDIGQVNDEVLIVVLIRAKMAEKLARSFDCDPDSAFIVCLFSLLDVMLSKPIEEILDPLPLGDDIKLALINHEGHLGDVLNFVVNYEQQLDISLPETINAEEVNQAYVIATEWVMSIQNQLN
jgi:EAL and modified HD-GYP domain-containing signal transduction protein